MKLTAKQEAFAQAYVETGNASEAYRQSYSTKNMKPETVNRAAFEATQHPKVSARVAELQQFHAKRHEITVDSLSEKLEAAYALAQENGQTAAMVAAVKEMGVLHGVRVERSENKNKNSNSYEALPDDQAELEAHRQARIIARLGDTGRVSEPAEPERPTDVH